MDITLTRKIKVSVFVPETIVDERERKDYKDETWKTLRKVNQYNFEFHNFLVKKLLIVDSEIWSYLNTDRNFIEIRNQYFVDRKNKANQTKYFNYIKTIRQKHIEDQGYKSIHSYIYDYFVKYMKELPEEEQIINSYTYCAISKNVVDKFNLDYFDVSRGDKNIAYYKKNQPIPINIKTQPRIDENGNLVKNMGMDWFNKCNDKYNFKFKSVKDKKIELELLFGRDKSNNRIFIDRIYDNDSKYKICDSKIQIVDNEIFLLLSIKQFDVEVKNLNSNKVLGVDLGIKCAAYIATNNSFERKEIGDKQFALMKTKLVIEKDKRSVQRNSIFSRSGHGRKRMTQKIEDFKEYEKNFRNTFNHKISSEIINHAIKWNCGVINVEDLSVIPKELKDNKILRNWAYFDLLSKIEYKAKKNGIQFNKVNPAYTSKKCNCCGEIGERPKQEVFICTNPKCKEFNKIQNADYNAAKNIANLKN